MSTKAIVPATPAPAQPATPATPATPPAPKANAKVELARMETAVIALLREKSKVFYANLVLQMIRVEEDKCPTMGVSINNGSIYLYFNPDFVAKLSLSDIIAVLEHEVLHLVMEHLFRMKNRQGDIWNIAADMAINQMIQNLPKWKDEAGNVCECVMPDKYKLPKDMNAEFYYKKLVDKAEKINVGMCGAGKNGQIDDHGKWGQGNGKIDPQVEKEIVKQAIKQAYEESQKQGRGYLPAGLVQQIEEWLKPPTIPWQSILRQYVGNKVKAGSKSTWKRASRRYGDSHKGRTPVRMIKIGVALDTSGSMGTEEFQEFISEMKGIQATYKSDISIMECDADVGKVYTLKPNKKVDTKFTGRGGTAYEPIFDKINKERKYRPDLLIFFTDFYCSFPKKKPDFPVLWIVTSRGDQNAKPNFGFVLRIPPKKAKNNE